MKTTTKEVFQTHNLDLAAVLVAHGNTCTIKRTHEIGAIFTFEKTPDVEKLWPKFFKGEITINITSFLYSRTSLKHWMKSLPIAIKPKRYVFVNRAAPLTLVSGQPYWYVEGRAVFNSLYGDKEPHLTRVKEGNVYKTKFEAQVAASAKDVTQTTTG